MKEYDKQAWIFWSVLVTIFYIFISDKCIYCNISYGIYVIFCISIFLNRNNTKDDTNNYSEDEPFWS